MLKKKILKLELVDQDGTIEEMLRLIQKNSGQGHTFDVVVDPDAKNTSDSHGKFEIDGDGSDKLRIIEGSNFSERVDSLFMR